MHSFNPDDIKDVDNILVIPERNDWIRENGQDLILACIS